MGGLDMPQEPRTPSGDPDGDHAARIGARQPRRGHRLWAQRPRAFHDDTTRSDAGVTTNRMATCTSGHHAEGQSTDAVLDARKWHRRMGRLSRGRDVDGHPGNGGVKSGAQEAPRGVRARRRATDYQAAAEAASVMPWDSSQRSASMAALQPSAAAVTAWRYRWSWTSPAMKTPSILEPVSSWTTR